MLHLKKLTKMYNGKSVVNGIDLSVKPGEIAVFLGSSGVGKSTLLRLMNNLEKIDGGTILLDGKQLDPELIHQNQTVGMVFQNFNLFNHLTVEQNITLALEQVMGKSSQEAKQIAHALLKEYDLFSKRDCSVDDLSGGQKQRLALIRALALKPKIICLDEPTSALDPLLTNYVADMIQKLGEQGYIVLIATHDTGLLDKLDCTIHLMQDGNIVESAASKEFYANPQQKPRINAFVLGKK